MMSNGTPYWTKLSNHHRVQEALSPGWMWIMIWMPRVPAPCLAPTTPAFTKLVKSGQFRPVGPR